MDVTARRARVSVALVFATNGAVFGTWTPRIPTVKQTLGLDEAGLGLALLGPAAGSLLSMLLAGALTVRYGSRRVMVIALAVFAVVPVLIGAAGSLVSLFVVLLVWGAAMGALDVAMNTAGLGVQHAYRRPILSSFHAAFSAGGLLGAAAGAVAAHLDVTVATHLAIAGCVGLVVTGVVGRVPLPDVPGTPRGGPVVARPTRALAALGLLAFAGLLAEGAAADWSAVYLADDLGASAGVAGAGFVAFSLTMTLGRLVADRVVATVGPVTTIRTAATIAATGLAAALLIGRPWAALAGFALLGAGLAGLVPVVLTAAADRSDNPGAAVAAVSTCGYLGFIAGPPLIGVMAAGTGLPLALGLVAVLTAAVAALAPAARRSPVTARPDGRGELEPLGSHRRPI